MRILKILEYIVFSFFVLLFILLIIRVIRKIVNFCKNTRETYNLETNKEQEKTNETKIIFKNNGGKEESESKSDTPKDMEAAWLDINREKEKATTSTSAKEAREKGITRRQKEMDECGPDLNA